MKAVQNKLNATLLRRVTFHRRAVTTFAAMLYFETLLNHGEQIYIYIHIYRHLEAVPEEEIALQNV